MPLPAFAHALHTPASWDLRGGARSWHLSAPGGGLQQFCRGTPLFPSYTNYARRPVCAPRGGGVRDSHLAGSRYPQVILALPVSQLCKVRHSSVSRGPAARWMQPSTAGNRAVSCGAPRHPLSPFYREGRGPRREDSNPWAVPGLTRPRAFLPRPPDAPSHLHPLPAPPVPHFFHSSGNRGVGGGQRGPRREPAQTRRQGARPVRPALSWARDRGAGEAEVSTSRGGAGTWRRVRATGSAARVGQGGKSALPAAGPAASRHLRGRSLGSERRPPKARPSRTRFTNSWWWFSR